MPMSSVYMESTSRRTPQLFCDEHGELKTTCKQCKEELAEQEAILKDLYCDEHSKLKTSCKQCKENNVQTEQIKKE